MFRSTALKCLLLSILAKEVKSFQDVEIDSGVVRGYPAEDGDYLAYLGIPYAEPPLGNLRFKAPLPPQPWNNIFNATRKVNCPQNGTGEEDCLVVNVFTPTSILNRPLPVVVYIHGGAYSSGSGQSQGAEPLIKENIVVVTINYRLGALGFLCLGVDEAPGNAGLKDQVAALEWVQRNIEKFGGDPNKVTAYGMSAGAASVDLIMLSNMGEGLFHKAIIESGVGTSVWSVDADPIQTALGLAKTFGFENNLDKFDSDKLDMLIDLYRRLPADELSAANMEYYRNLTDGTFGFVPCVEKVFDTAAFITESPRQIIQKYGYHNKVPTIFIFASSEGLYLRSSRYLNYRDRMEANFKDFMLADLIFDTEEIEDQIAGNIRLFYFGNNSIGDTTLMEYLDYFGDTYILHGLLNSALTYAENEVDVYLMEFAYKGQMGTFDEIFEHLNLAGHGNALKHVILNKSADEDDDVEAVGRMAKIIANFAKFSNPIPSMTEQLPLYWPVLRPDNVTYLRFDRDLQLAENPYWERKIFWDRLYEVYRRDINPVDNGVL